MARFNMGGFLAAVCLACLQFTSGEAADPILRLGVNDEFVNYDKDQPELFAKDVNEVCAEGVWITYNDFYYSIDDTLFGYGVSIFPEMEYNCHSPIFEVPRSARPAGSRRNSSAISVALFSGAVFTGFTETITLDYPFENVAFPIKSLVIISSNTFTDKIELFRDPNLVGESICFQPNAEECADNVCWLFDWDSDEVSKLPFNPLEARSVRVGCSINTDVYQPEHRSYRAHVYRNKA